MDATWEVKVKPEETRMLRECGCRVVWEDHELWTLYPCLTHSPLGRDRLRDEIVKEAKGLLKKPLGPDRR